MWLLIRRSLVRAQVEEPKSGGRDKDIDAQASRSFFSGVLSWIMRQPNGRRPEPQPGVDLGLQLLFSQPRTTGLVKARGTRPTLSPQVRRAGHVAKILRSLRLRSEAPPPHAWLQLRISHNYQRVQPRKAQVNRTCRSLNLTFFKASLTARPWSGCTATAAECSAVCEWK